MTTPTLLAMVAGLLAIASVGIYAVHAWYTAASLRQLILNSPIVCHHCATYATSMSHHQGPEDSLEGGFRPDNGGLLFRQVHDFVPAKLVYMPDTQPTEEE